MASNNPANAREQWSYGRGFASTDPERQGELVAMHRGPIETVPPQRVGAPRSSRLDWTRVQPGEGSAFEGSSSRRGR